MYAPKDPVALRNGACFQPFSVMNQWQMHVQYNMYATAIQPNHYHQHCWPAARHYDYYAEYYYQKTTATNYFHRSGFYGGVNYFPPHFVKPRRPVRLPLASSRSDNRVNNQVRSLDRAGKETTQAAVQNKIYSILRQLNSENIGIKSAEIKSMITADDVTWLSEFLVSKLHRYDNQFGGYSSLYQKFFDHLGNKGLDAKIISVIVSLINELLENNTQRTARNRAKLENLGQLLGCFTLKKNRPVLWNEVDVRNVLEKAMDDGNVTELNYLIPFVVKILESSISSKIFGAKKNPWTRAVLRTLTDIYKKFNSRLYESSVLNIKLLFEMIEYDVLPENQHGTGPPPDTREMAQNTHTRFH